MSTVSPEELPENESTEAYDVARRKRLNEADPVHDENVVGLADDYVDETHGLDPESRHR